MPVLEILQHPDTRLRRKALPVTVFDRNLSKLVEDMFETMYEAPGVGLAANQVGVHLRVAVMDCSAPNEPPRPLVMVNPEIIDADDRQEMEEGCLSVADYRDKILRYNRLRVRAQDREGKVYELDAEGLLAQAVQHEIDHLDGKLYIDRLSSLKRERLKKKFDKDVREQAPAKTAAKSAPAKTIAKAAAR